MLRVDYPLSCIPFTAASFQIYSEACFSCSLSLPVRDVFRITPFTEDPANRHENTASKLCITGRHGDEPTHTQKKEKKDKELLENQRRPRSADSWSFLHSYLTSNLTCQVEKERKLNFPNITRSPLERCQISRDNGGITVLWLLNQNGGAIIYNLLLGKDFSKFFYIILE